MNALQTAAKSCLLNCGGAIDGADTTDGLDYVMVRRSDFDALQYAMAEKSHLLGPDDMVACLLENGNVWWYPVKDVKRALWSEMPRSNRRSYLRRHGYKLLA